MSLKKLMKLVQPPKKPTEPGTKTKWAKVEKELGTPLPTDYKEFIDLYGTGFFGGLFYVFNPFAASAAHNLLDQFKEQGDYFRQQRANDEEEHPYDVFPKKPGLLPWGRDSVGNTYFWLVKPKVKPDDWPVIFYEPRGGGFQDRGCSFSEYLEGILSRKIKAPLANYPAKESFKFDAFEAQEPVSVAALIEAIGRNDVKRTRELLDAGVDVHDPEIQENGLMIATQKPDFEIAKLLLERGADPNGDGKLLSIMAEAGQVGAVLFLLDAGADPNRSRRSGGPALFGAANNFNVEMVLALLAKGADVNARDGRDRTPIFRVAQYNEPAAAGMIRVLVEHGADLSARNGEGQTPLEFAKAEGGPLSVAALEEAAKAAKKK